MYRNRKDDWNSRLNEKQSSTEFFVLFSGQSWCQLSVTHCLNTQKQFIIHHIQTTNKHQMITSFCSVETCLATNVLCRIPSAGIWSDEVTNTLSITIDTRRRSHRFSRDQSFRWAAADIWTRFKTNKQTPLVTFKYDTSPHAWFPYDNKGIIHHLIILKYWLTAAPTSTK